jgi:UDP-N-acetyl-2-amino-2-deoxyglucuronate dehydrogenase
LRKTRFGIIGCGSAAVPVCEAIVNLPETTLGRVQDINLDLAQDLGERYNVPYTTDLGELLDDAELDAIYIAVPHYLLAGLAKRVLESNKHALVEKPLALTLSEIDELIVLAESKKLALGVFYEMRYAPCFAQARQLVQAGAVGEIIAVKVHTLIDKRLSYWHAGYTGRTANPWRGEKAKAGGGVTLMNTSHLLDALWFVTDLNIVRDSAEMGTLVADVEVEDTLAAVLRFENGAVGNLFADAHIVGATAQEVFEVYGKCGTLRLPDLYSQNPLQVYLREAWREIPANVWHTVPHTVPRGQVNVFESAVQAFADSVQAGQPAPINGYDARRVLQTVLGLYRAADELSAIVL